VIVLTEIANHSEFPVFYPCTFSLALADEEVPRPGQTGSFLLPESFVAGKFVVEPGQTSSGLVMAFIVDEPDLDAGLLLRWQSRRHGLRLEVRMPEIRNVDGARNRARKRWRQ
jgi:hypothetical protein